jgi:hypothetical protein
VVETEGVVETDGAAENGAPVDGGAEGPAATGFGPGAQVTTGSPAADRAEEPQPVTVSSAAHSSTAGTDKTAARPLR